MSPSGISQRLTLHCSSLLGRTFVVANTSLAYHVFLFLYLEKYGWSASRSTGWGVTSSVSQHSYLIAAGCSFSNSSWFR